MPDDEPLITQSFRSFIASLSGRRRTARWSRSIRPRAACACSGRSRNQLLQERPEAFAQLGESGRRRMHLVGPVPGLKGSRRLDEMDVVVLRRAGERFQYRDEVV